MPLPTQRKTKDGGKILMHEDYLVPYLQQEESEVDNENPDGYTPLERYPHNSKKLDDLLASEEWSYNEEEPSESADYIQAAAVMNLMTATKAGIQDMALTNKEVNKLVSLLPKWEDLEGQELPAGFKLQYIDKPYKVIQGHTVSKEWLPSEERALYGLISDHDGTLSDPIPYERLMVLEKDKYYTQFGVLYLCTTDSIVGYDEDLAGLAALVTVVNEE